MWGGGGGALTPSVVAGGLLPVDVTDAPTLFGEGPKSVPSRISVVRVDGTIAGDTPCVHMRIGMGDRGLA